MKRRHMYGDRNVNAHMLNNKYPPLTSLYDHHMRALRDIYSSDTSVRAKDRTADNIKGKRDLTKMFFSRAKEFHSSGTIA